MFKSGLTLVIAAATGVAGWLGGSVYPAPPEWTDAINRHANDLRAKVRLEASDLQGLKQLVSAEKFDAFTQEVTSIAVAAGEVIEVERDNGTLEEQLDNLAMTAEAAIPGGLAAAPAPVVAADPASPAAPAPAPAPPGAVAAMPPPAGFGSTLEICPRMTVQNSPKVEGLQVASFNSLVDVRGVKLAVDPAQGACLSSGFGPRSDRLHKGLDFHNAEGGAILAAADGQIVEMKFRDDYGNMLLIDHGGGVFTRYAHLASFGRGLSSGVTVRAGEQIGLMGNTASYQVPIHLHYELLIGDYGNPKGSFGLEPADPLAFPAAP